MPNPICNQEAGTCIRRRRRARMETGMTSFGTSDNSRSDLILRNTRSSNKNFPFSVMIPRRPCLTATCRGQFPSRSSQWRLAIAMFPFLVAFQKRKPGLCASLAACASIQYRLRRHGFRTAIGSAAAATHCSRFGFRIPLSQLVAALATAKEIPK